MTMRRKGNVNSRRKSGRLENREDLVCRIMANTGATRADVEHLFETQGLWLNDPESEEMIKETQKGFERWKVEER